MNKYTITALTSALVVIMIMLMTGTPANAKVQVSPLPTYYPSPTVSASPTPIPVSTSVPTPVSTPVMNTNTQCVNFTRNLGVNMNMTVKEYNSLNKIFKNEGIGSLTGQMFDEDYAAAIVKLQAKYGIVQTGFFGPITRAKVNSIYDCSGNGNSGNSGGGYSGGNSGAGNVNFVCPTGFICTPITPTPEPNSYSSCISGTVPQVDVSKYSPKLLNIDFGSPHYNPLSSRTGPAVVGNYGDIWNGPGGGACDYFLTSNFKNADGSKSPTYIEVRNLGGGWSTSNSGGTLGINDSMLNDFSYPMNNKGGNAYIQISNVPVDSYDLYLYNKTMTDSQNGDYTVSVGGRNYGRKLTTTDVGSHNATSWQENNQFVKFANVVVNTGESINIEIQPGVGAYHDAQISGLQLAPAGTPYAVPVTVYQGSTVQPVTNNQTPVITGGTFPTQLNVGQTGTWSVSAYDPQNSALTYSVDWGEGSSCPAGYTCTASARALQAFQTSTFTHSFNSPGTYTITFKVSNSSGLSAQTTSTVNVTNSGTSISNLIVTATVEDVSPSYYYSPVNINAYASSNINVTGWGVYIDCPKGLIVGMKGGAGCNELQRISGTSPFNWPISIINPGTTNQVVNIKIYGYSATGNYSPDWPIIAQGQTSVTIPPSNNIPSSSQAPTARFTIEGQHEYTYNVGQTDHYSWSSTNADTFSSSYTATGPSICGGGPWVANTAQGSLAVMIGNQYAGCVWTVTYTASNSQTGQSASDTVIVKVNPISTTPATRYSPAASTTEPIIHMPTSSIHEERQRASIWDAIQEYYRSTGDN